MRKQFVFRQTLLVGAMSLLLGLGACAIQSEEPVFSDDVQPAEDVQLTEDFIVPEVDTACTSDDGDCVASDDYLTSPDQTLLDVGMDRTDENISLSRPAGHGTISVRDKQAMVQAMSTPAMPVENTAVSKGASKTEPATEEKVLYTTVAIPEELGTTKTTETTLTTTKVTKTPAEEEPTEVPAGMMPLKKTITTITETTTKVKVEKDPPKDFAKMTLAERIEYGESAQDWEAVSGNTLRGLLMDWGRKAGWTVVWKLDRDYRLEAGVTFRGTFTEVAGALIRSFARATPAPIGTFHGGNRVLVVNTQENENEH